MKRVLLTLIVMVGLFLVSVSAADAARWRRGGFFFGARVQVPHPEPPRKRFPQYEGHPSRQIEATRRYADDYPRYIGGFHYRYFQDYGFPPGDSGIRSDEIYRPW